MIGPLTHEQTELHLHLALKLLEGGTYTVSAKSRRLPHDLPLRSTIQHAHLEPEGLHVQIHAIVQVVPNAHWLWLDSVGWITAFSKPGANYEPDGTMVPLGDPVVIFAPLSTRLLWRSAVETLLAADALPPPR
jgi:hypothetical protein